MDHKSKIILISGPTASGKSSFAIKIAKKIKGEIINADSMQVYREFKILTARPNLIEQKKNWTSFIWFFKHKKKFFNRSVVKTSYKKNKGNSQKK